MDRPDEAGLMAAEFPAELPSWWGDPGLLRTPPGLGVELAEIFSESWVRTAYTSDGDGGCRSEVLAEAGLGVRLARGGAVAYGFSSGLELTGLRRAMDQAAVALAALAGNGSRGAGSIRSAVGGHRRGAVGDRRRPAGAHAGRRPVMPEPATSSAVKAGYVARCPREGRLAAGPELEVTGYLEEDSRVVAVANSAGGSGVERADRSRIWVTARVAGTVRRVVVSPGLRIPAGALIESAGSAALAEAAARATGLAAAVPVPAGRYDLVLAPHAAGFFIHETCGHACEADAFSKDSALGAMFGRPVAPPELAVIDDSADAGAWGSFGIDDEGTPARPVTLIDAGVLHGVLSGLLPEPASRWIGQQPESSWLAGSAPTGTQAGGRGRRASYQHPPLPRLSHTRVPAGRAKPDEVIGSVRCGIHVTEIAAGRFTPRDGLIWLDIAEAQMIRNGCLAEHVTGGRISLDVRQALGSVGAVCSDPRPRAATCMKRGQQVPVSVEVPTLLLPGATVLARG